MMDLKSRLQHHSGGHAPSTRRLGNLKLVFHQEFENLLDARHVEKRIKKLKRKDYIEKIVAEGHIRMNVKRA